MQKSNTGKGFFLAILAAIFWGVSGTLGQYLFQIKEVNVEWLITVRMLFAGIVLLGAAVIRKNPMVWKIWTIKKDAWDLIIFSTLGIVAVQYTYFAAVKHSNAATATVLQYIGPVIIAVFLALKYKRAPKIMEYIAIFLAAVGSFLLVTHGNIYTLSISPLALFLGIISAFALAFYTLQPISLVKKYNSTIIIGWGMLIGGVLFSFVKSPFKVEGLWDIYTYASTGFILVFATLIAFYAYSLAVQYIGGQKSSLLASLEPLSATLLAVFWLHTPFQFMDWLGTFCIIATILLLSYKRK